MTGHVSSSPHCHFVAKILIEIDELAVLYIVQAVESDLAIISSSLPALQPLFHYFSLRIGFENAKHQSRKPPVEFDYRRGNYRTSLADDQKLMIRMAEIILAEQPAQKDQRYISREFEMARPDVPVVEELPLNPVKTWPRNSSLHLNEPPGAPPNYPPPPIPPERHPARIQRYPSDVSLTNEPQNTPLRDRITPFPPQDRIPPLRGILKKSKDPVAENDTLHNAKRSTMWPVNGIPQPRSSFQAEKRFNPPPESVYRLPDFRSRETMWPAYDI